MILKLSHQTRALIALTALADANPELPAPEMHVRGHITMTAMVTVDLTLHGDEDGFEAWRQALGITPHEVQTRKVEFGGWVSSAHTIRLGVAIVLTVHHRQGAPSSRTLAVAA